MNGLSLQSVVVAAPNQVSADLNGSAAVLSLSSGEYYGLEDVAGRVWTLIREPQRVEQVRDRIVAEYDVDAGQCETDLMTLLRELLAEGLIEVRSA